jgi:hypothetical protein
MGDYRSRGKLGHGTITAIEGNKLKIDFEKS